MSAARNPSSKTAPTNITMNPDAMLRGPGALAIINPEAETRYRHQLARESYRAGYGDGWREGRRHGCKPGCTRCETRTRDTYGLPHADDFNGRDAA